MLVFEEGENRSTWKKTSRSKEENQQQTQPTYGVDAGIWTRATLVGGNRSHHCTIPCSSSLSSSCCCTCTNEWNITDIFVVVQFCPWFKFSFLLFQTHYHTSYLKTKKNKCKSRTKLDHNIFFIKYIFYIHCHFICISIQIIIHEQSL